MGVFVVVGVGVVVLGSGGDALSVSEGETFLLGERGGGVFGGGGGGGGALGIEVVVF